MDTTKVRRFGLGIALATFAALSAQAQGVGTLKITVKDPSSAVVPNAQIHVTGSGQTKDDKTDGQGLDTLTLPPGQYTVRITAPGFVTATQQSVTVTSGQTSPLRYRARHHRLGVAGGCDDLQCRNRQC